MTNLSVKKNVWFIMAVCVFFLVTGLQIKAKNSCNEKDLLITYDYLNLKKPLTGGGNGNCYVVNFRGNVTFRVINVNPFLYRVRINSTLKDYFLESPKIYQETAREAIEMKKNKSEQTLSVNISNAVEIAKKSIIDDINTVQKKITIKYDEVKKAEEASQAAIQSQNDAILKKDVADTNLKLAKDEKEKADKELEEAKLKNAQDSTYDIKPFNDRVENLNIAIKEAEQIYTNAKSYADQAATDATEKTNDFNKKIKEVQDKWNKLVFINDFLVAYKKMDIILDFYYQLIEIVFKKAPFITIENCVKGLIDDTKKKNPDINNIALDFRQWINNALDTYSNIDFFWLNQKDDKGFTPLTPEQSELLKAYGKNIDTIKELNVIGKIQTIFDNLTEKNFKRSVTIPNVESDEIQFKAEIEPLANAGDVDVLQQIIGPVVVKVQRGWVINFSTGVLFHFNAHDRTYRIEEAPTQDTANPKYYIRENENKTSITHGVVALMHIYPRSVSDIRWGGLSFGLGTEDTKRINYYFGTGFMFGSLGRFVVNIGLVLTEIDYLKPGYKKDVEVKLADNVTAEDLVEKQLKPRVFFGFTYNLNN